MKDLYTFDHTPEAALSTYQAVRTAYNNVFNELKVPYLVADADSGNMGGKLSHEYHFASPKGEDNVWSCDTCEYVANEELVEKRVESSGSRSSDTLVFTGISMDRTTRIDIHVPRPTSMAADAVQPTWIDVHSFLNLHALKKTGIDIDTGIEASTLASLLPKTTQHSTVNDPSLDLTPTREGDACPRCPNGHLNVCKAIEVAHTFHLGTRYSLPLNLLITTPDHPKPQPVHMGCHGIGLSRLIGATASLLSSPTGLHWPRAIAPFEVAVLEPTHVSTGGENASEEASAGQKIYDELTDRRDFGLERSGLDVVLDDRPKSLGWKLKDADLIGYPVLVVLGRAWKDKAEVEVQCRRLGVKKEVKVENLRDEVLGLLDRV
jgi:prolyl-tRNA synthetase